MAPCLVLDLQDVDGFDFKEYKTAIARQLRTGGRFFHDRFLDALQSLPGLSPDEFLIRIVVKVDRRGANVSFVLVESSGKKLQKEDQWEEETVEREKERNKCRNNRPIGIVVVDFEVYSPFGDDNVGFRVEAGYELDMPDGNGRLPPYHKSSKGWAYKIADSLSDDQPGQVFPWYVSPDLVETMKARSPPGAQFLWPLWVTVREVISAFNPIFGSAPSGFRLLCWDTETANASHYFVTPL